MLGQCCCLAGSHSSLHCPEHPRRLDGTSGRLWNTPRLSHIHPLETQGVVRPHLHQLALPRGFQGNTSVSLVMLVLIIYGRQTEAEPEGQKHLHRRTDMISGPQMGKPFVCFGAGYAAEMLQSLI